MVAFNTSISADGDDGWDTGTAWSTHIDNYAGSISFRIQDNGVGVRQGGVRFLNITIPNGATINSATITMVANSSLSPFTSLTAFGDNVDSAPAWSNSSRPTSGFTDTTAGTSQTTLPATGSFTVDIQQCVQDIVNRAGWASGGNMRFRLLPVAAYSQGSIADFDGSHSNEAQIDIDYTVSGGSTTALIFRMRL